jgi:Sec-independent protein translocase protein TatA
MFGIDFETLIILAVLAFILFGPEKLPEYAASLGRFVAKMRQASSEVTRQYQNPFQYPPEPTLPPASESFCQHCQRKVGTGFTFCAECGQRLKSEHSPPPAQESTCPYCQQKVGPEFSFCPKCGHRLKEDHYPPPPSQQPQVS